MTYTLHYDPQQSESRSVLAFLDHFNVPFTPIVYENGAHLTNKLFTTINPLKDLPHIETNEISLTGAHTIIRFLADILLEDSHLFYPKDNLALR